MNDKLVFHYQYVSHATNKEPTVHEAYSRNGVIELLNPEPVRVNNDEEESLFTAMIEKDYVQYGVVNYKTVKQAALRYIDTTAGGSYALPDYSVQDEDYPDDDFYDDDDKVIAIDDYINRRR